MALKRLPIAQHQTNIHPRAPFWHTADEIAQRVKQELKHSDAQALRWLTEGVNLLTWAQQNGDLDRCLVEPRTSIDARWDTLLAAQIRYRLRHLGLTPDAMPSWTRKPPLAEMWFPAVASTRQYANAINLAPLELRRVGIMIPEPALQ